MWKQRTNDARCFFGVFIVLMLCIVFAYKFSERFENFEKRLKQAEDRVECLENDAAFRQQGRSMDNRNEIRSVQQTNQFNVKQPNFDQSNFRPEQLRDRHDQLTDRHDQLKDRHDQLKDRHVGGERRPKPQADGSQIEIVKEELEKELRKMEKYSNKLKSMNLKEASNDVEKMKWYRGALERLEYFKEAIRKLNTLTAQDITDQRKLWRGRSPVEVFNKWNGIIPTGDLPLRRFVGTDNVDAARAEQLFEQMSNIAVDERFYQLMRQIHVHCLLQKRMGYYKDGGWDICMSEPYRLKRSNCLVYSFGINNDFSFDDDIDKTYGCKVKAYDPSMSVESHSRSKNVYFYAIGLGGKDEINNKNWQLKTFSTILKENGHSNAVIDYLKMDIETSEFPALREMVASQSLKNVKQLSFEIHLYKRSRQALLNYYLFLYDLEKFGFRRYFYHENPRCMKQSLLSGLERSACHELYYINVNFL